MQGLLVLDPKPRRVDLVKVRCPKKIVPDRWENLMGEFSNVLTWAKSKEEGPVP